MTLVKETIDSLAAEWSSTAEFYRTNAGRFEPGSLGYLGNIGEAEKYANMAANYRDLSARMNASSEEG